MEIRKHPWFPFTPLWDIHAPRGETATPRCHHSGKAEEAESAMTGIDDICWND
jgi:hypothetical protein